jgi:hypothetical protein
MLLTTFACEIQVLNEKIVLQYLHNLKRCETQKGKKKRTLHKYGNKNVKRDIWVSEREALKTVFPLPL